MLQSSHHLPSFADNASWISSAKLCWRSFLFSDLVKSHERVNLCVVFYASKISIGQIGEKTQHFFKQRRMILKSYQASFTWVRHLFNLFQVMKFTLTPWKVFSGTLLKLTFEHSIQFDDFRIFLSESGSLGKNHQTFKKNIPSTKTVFWNSIFRFP